MRKSFTLLTALALALATLPSTVTAQTNRGRVPRAAVRFTGQGTETKQVTKRLLATQRTPVLRATDGQAYSVPYLQTFDDEIDFNTFSKINANKDDATWEYDDDNQCALYRWSSDNAADDWLISPGINLKAGKSYTVAFKTRSNSNRFAERIEAKWGPAATVEGMTGEILPRTDIKSGKWEVYKKDISPTEDGVYYFGFHAISDADQFYLRVDSISITQGAETTAPDSVTNLKATPDATGALSVSFAFNAPTTAIDGTPLSSIDSVVVANCGLTVVKLEAVTPGQALTATDGKALAGANKYSIVAYNASGAGRPAYITVTAGPDIPTSPEVTATDNLTSVTLSWPTVKGANGGIILPSDVSYDIYNVTNDGHLSDSIASVKGANEYTIEMSTTDGAQNYQHWAVRARNAAGTSGYGVAEIIVGAPYNIPFSNSFANGTLENQFVGLISTRDYPTWDIVTDQSVDNDGGALLFSNYFTGYFGSDYGYPGEATIVSGKIRVRGAINPKLRFSYNGTTSTDSRLIAEIEHQNGVVDSIWSADFTGQSSWQTVTIDLPASVANDNYISVRFRGFSDTESKINIYVDDIHVFDPYNIDGAVSIEAPESLSKGQTANFVATVSNQGLQDLTNIGLKISVNDEVVADTTIAKTLSTFDSVEIPVSYKTSSTSSASALNVKAELEYEYDLDDNNNTALATIALNQTDLAAPTGLTGSNVGADSIALAWTAPETSQETVSDDFESYTPWAIDKAGDWTFVNADGGVFGNLTDTGDEPNAAAKAAYEIWKPSDVFGPGQGLDPHSGEQCLTSVYKTDAPQQNYVDADDWIISPELPGTAQTITFYVNNLRATSYGTETFQVLASATNKETTSFKQVGSDYTQATGSWKQISVDLPAGTRFFAIRRVTSGEQQFLFMVDDISYAKGQTAAAYNVYVDNTLAGSTTGTDFTLPATDKAPHSYSVTAVYADGSESLPVSLTVTGIKTIERTLQADSYDVFTLDGAQVLSHAKDLRGLKPGLYIVNGKRVIVK